jgi:hypothetical protein
MMPGTVISRPRTTSMAGVLSNSMASKNPRYKLIGKKYFCGIYEGGKGNEKLWMEVAEYIEKTYDTDYLERIYVVGDGASWIKKGCEYLENSKYVLDKYHIITIK